MQDQSSSLSKLFAPPLSLRHSGSFREARELAVVDRKWVLLNLQKNDEFDCHRLNRDTWSFPTLQEVLRAYFVFVQEGESSEKGLELSSLYSPEPDSRYPQIHIIDPRTGESLVELRGFLSPEELLEKLLPFVDEHAEHVAAHRESLLKFWRDNRRQQAEAASAVSRGGASLLLGPVGGDGEDAQDEEGKVVCDICLKRIDVTHAFMHGIHCDRTFARSVRSGAFVEAASPVSLRSPLRLPSLSPRSHTEAGASLRAPRSSLADDSNSSLACQTERLPRETGSPHRCDSHASLPEEHLPEDALPRTSLAHLPGDKVTRISLTDHLPEDVLTAVVGFLTPQALAQCAHVSREFREACVDSYVWHLKLDEHVLDSWHVNFDDESLLQHDRPQCKLSAQVDNPWGAFRRAMGHEALIAQSAFTCRRFTGHSSGVTCVKHVDVVVDRKSSLNQSSTPNGFNADPANADWDALELADSGAPAGPCAIASDNIHTFASTTFYSPGSQAKSPRLLVSGSADNSCILWDMNSRTPLKRFVGHTDTVNDICVDSYKIVSAGADSRVCMWSLHLPADPAEDGGPPTMQPVWRKFAHTKPVLCCAFDSLYRHSPARDDGGGGTRDASYRMMTGSWDNMKLWDLERQESVGEIVAHRGATFGIQFFGSLALSCSGDCAVSLWDTRTSQISMRISDHKDSVYALKWDGYNTAVSGSYDKQVRLLDLRMGKSVHAMTGHTRPIEAIDVTASKIFSGARDGSVRVWDVLTGEHLSTLTSAGATAAYKSRSASTGLGVPSPACESPDIPAAGHVLGLSVAGDESSVYVASKDNDDLVAWDFP